MAESVLPVDRPAEPVSPPSALPVASAIIVAAGKSARMRGIDKLYADLDGRPLLYHALAAFQASVLINHIMLVVSLDAADRALALLRTPGLTKVDGTCVGGERRQDSVRAGLQSLRACQWVVVHDGARPFVTPRMIEDGIAAALETGASSAGLPLVDTLKEVASDNTVLWTVSRERLWTVQTPQVFRYDLLSTAHERDDLEATDDAGLVERIGGRIRVYPGSAMNLKVTGPEDLALARALLASQQARPARSAP